MGLEELIFEKGKSIIEGAKKHRPGKISQRYIANAFFDACMKDPYTKTQIFRFIDVLPSLDTADDVLKHFREYVLDRNVNTAFLGLGHALSLAAKANPRLAALALRRFAERMASEFIAGKDVYTALDETKKLLGSRMLFTLDRLGEKTTSEMDAEDYMNSYLDTLDSVSCALGINSKDQYDNPIVNVSVKLSSLYSRFDPIDQEGTSGAVNKRLRQIFRKAKEKDAFVNIDTEDYHSRDMTYRIFRDILLEDEFRDFSDAGIVVQAYLKDSEMVLEDLISWTRKNKHPITIRLVKGAYWDHEVMLAGKNSWDIPVFTEKWQTDRNYELLTRMILENSEYTHAAIATHNIRSIANALVLKDGMDVKPGHFEIQMLYGTGEETRRALNDQDAPLRIYVPFGELIPGMGFFVRRLLENSANESFLRAFDSEAEPSVLLRNPEELNDMEEECADAGSHPVKSRISGFFDYFRKSKHYAAKQGCGADTVFMNSPACDFSKESGRKAMEKSIKKMESRFGNIHYPLRIGRERIGTGDHIESRNPARVSELIGTASRAGPEHIGHALREAKSAFRTWQHTSPEERAAFLADVAGQMRKRMYDLSSLIVSEAGKTWKEAHGDVSEAIDFLNFYSSEMIRMGAGAVTQKMPGEENTINYIPKGTVAVISPWNFPLAILTGMASASIVTGNTVVMKPASDTPLIAGELVRMFDKAGLPPGVLNYVPGTGSDIGKCLVESPLVDMVAFTGSRDVGLWIYEKISKVCPGQENVKTAVLEMGGKNGIIIDSSADIDEAIPGVLNSAFGYQGQKCSACSRLIVLDSVYDEFTANLAESAKSLRTGDPRLPSTDIGPVISRKAYDRIIWYIEQGKKDGGTMLLEGECSDNEGFYISPSMIECGIGNIIAKEEIFGPVLAVMRAGGMDEAMEILNSTDYALTGGIYTRTPSHIEQFMKGARVGNRYINRGITGAVVERQPFGGFRMSGLGSKAGGKDYLLNFMYTVSNSEDTGRKGHIPGVEGFAR